MTLTELKYIIALARDKHFGRAAERCCVAQPTLSVAVKKIEDELGVMLFERSLSEVRVTPVGELIVAQAEKVLLAAHQIKEIALASGDPLQGPLRLGVIHTIGPYLLPRLAPLIKQRAPAMSLYLEEGYTSGLIEALKGGALDVAILALPIEEAGLAVQAIYDEEFAVLVPTAHRWAQQASVRVAELLHEPLLMLGRGNCLRDQVLDLCARAGNGGPQVLEGSSLETIRLMVASGIAPTVMPLSAVAGIAADDAQHKVLPFVAPVPSRRVGIAWRLSFPRHAVIDLIRQALLDCRLAGTKSVNMQNRRDAKDETK